MSARITLAEREAMIFGLNEGLHPKDIALSLGKNVRRVYEVKAMLRFAEKTNQPNKTGWAERIKHDFKRIFSKNGS